MPYISQLVGHATCMSSQRNNAERGPPKIIFLPSESTSETANIIAHMTNEVALSGSASMGNIGPNIGLIDIAESDDSYYFWVSLPGVSRDEKDFSCEIEPVGKIMIKGTTSTGERTVCKYNQVFKMLSQNLWLPRHFTISFQLPGHVSNEEFNGNFGPDGGLEGVVKKVYYEDETECYGCV